MLKLTVITFLLFSFANNSALVSQSVQPELAYHFDIANPKSIPTLSYCDLLKSHSRYTGKLVRLKASWQFGFERSCLTDQKCSGEATAWLEFIDDQQACPQSKENRQAPGKYDKEAEVTVVGKFYGPGRYGHLGAYEYKFVVLCLETIKVMASENTDK